MTDTCEKKGVVAKDGSLDEVGLSPPKAEGLLAIGTDGLLEVCNLARCNMEIVGEVATQFTLHLVDLFRLEHILSHETPRSC